MSKRELRKYLKELNKEQLEDQILDLYNRFKDVKEYYDFAFNPRENELIEQCRFQISTLSLHDALPICGCLFAGRCHVFQYRNSPNFFGRAHYPSGIIFYKFIQIIRRSLAICIRERHSL